MYFHCDGIFSFFQIYEQLKTSSPTVCNRLCYRFGQIERKHLEIGTYKNDLGCALLTIKTPKQPNRGKLSIQLSVMLLMAPLEKE